MVERGDFPSAPLIHTRGLDTPGVEVVLIASLLLVDIVENDLR